MHQYEFKEFQSPHMFMQQLNIERVTFLISLWTVPIRRARPPSRTICEVDISALEKAVAKHIDHGRVKNIVKLSEGGFNRVLLATMEDGLWAVIKIPYSISVPKTYATASEVTTRRFLRSKEIPVPEVYGGPLMTLKADVSDGASAEELGKMKRSWPFQDHEEFY
ncbi:phosphotransferase enzyme [Aspergillus brasiliensis]|nr:phosphotransferase enzyme [Aspergillus brasiliensis]